MEPGDLVLFYRKQEFISRGRVSFLLPDSDELANYLWDPHPESGPYRHVFFLDEMQDIRIPWGPVRDQLGYQENYYLQSLTVLDEERTTSLLPVISEFDSEIAEPDVRPRDSVEDDAAARAEEALEWGQGFASSAEVRAVVEDHSMTRATEFFQNLGFEVTDVSATRPYDLRCEHGDLTIHVEVKGTQAAGERVILTANEVEFARDHADRMVLFVVHSISVSENSAGEPRAENGTENVLMPWDVDEGELSPISYRYAVPES